MALIKKKLIHFRTKAKFEEYLAANDILDTSIVFIQDEKLIWTHGTYYTKSELDSDKYVKKSGDTMTGDLIIKTSKAATIDGTDKITVHNPVESTRRMTYGSNEILIFPSNTSSVKSGLAYALQDGSDFLGYVGAHCRGDDENNFYTFMGWGSNPHLPANSFIVSERELKYKNINVALTDSSNAITVHNTPGSNARTYLAGNGLTITPTSTNNATGLIWRNQNNTATLLQLGAFTNGDSETNYCFMGWGASPWTGINNLSVGADRFTYKSEKVWHAGNDGAGSGLDADTVDGQQPSELSVASATKLTTARTINGVSFDGTKNISITAPASDVSAWAKASTKPTYTASEVGALASGGTAVAASKTTGTLTINGTTFNGSSNVTVTTPNTTYSQATSSTLGLVKIGYPESGKNYPVELNSSGQMYVNVPWTDNNTTYGLATTSANGLLKQLNGSTSSFMRGDGTWATPPNTTYSVATTSANGLMSSSDKTKMDRQEGYTTATTVASLNVNYPVIYVTLGANASLSASATGTTYNGRSITAYVYCSAARTITIPTSGSYVSMCGSSYTCPAGKWVEFNLTCVAGVWHIAMLEQE